MTALDMDPRDIAHQVTVLAELANRVQAALLDARARLNTAMVTGDRLTVTHGDVTLASVTKAKGRTTVRISDPAALLAWMAEHHPEEVVTRQEIRPATVGRILADTKAAGQPCFGGTLDVPGLTVTTGEPTVSLRPTDDAPAAIDRMWASGVLDPYSLVPQLPGGEG